MDTERLLRRYLEQRRELGERELVLDDLTVEEALRIIGARSPADVASAGKAGHRGPKAVVPTTDTRADTRGGDGDWRAAVRPAGGEPAAAPPGGPPVDRTLALPTAPSPGRQRPPAPPGPAPVDADFADRLAGTPTIGALEELVLGCTRCPLHRIAINPVPGEGDPRADFMCVGEAPGADEDASGRPFVGRAGQLLTKILEAINLRREDVYIANVLKHRPPANRNPLPDEVAACRPYLVRQVEIIRPRVILALGTFAAQCLLETNVPIGRLRGAVHRFAGIPVVVTYHPAALLRNPAWKRPAWEDVQLARRILDSTAA